MSARPRPARAACVNVGEEIHLSREVTSPIQDLDEEEWGLKGLAMRLLGLMIGALVILVSAISFAAPDLRLSLEGSLFTPGGLYVIAGLRIVIGLVLVLA